jgi:hypothetical protein
LTNGWACYKNGKQLPPMKLDPLETFKKPFVLEDEVKSKRISVDRAHTIVMEDISAEDLHEQLLVTVARVKAFSGYSKDKQDKLNQA